MLALIPFIARQNLLAGGVLCVLAMCGTPGLSGAEEQPKNDFVDLQLRPFVTRYCADCHSGDEAAAGVPLDIYEKGEHVLQNRGVFEKVLANLKFESMPPEEAAELPSPEDRKAFIRVLENHLTSIDCEGVLDPGRVTTRRLNRVEYNLTIRDLVGVDFQPADDFPSDDVGYGFDHIGDVLSMPPLLMEKYLNAADAIVARAIVTSNPHESVVTRYEAERDLFRGGSARNSVRALASNGEIRAKLPFVFAADYVVRVRAYGQQAGPDPVRMAIRVSGKDVLTVDVPATQAEPGTYEVRVSVPAGEHRVGVGFLNDYYRPDDPDPNQRDRNFYLDWIEVEGPLDLAPPPLPETHTRILFRQPASDDEQVDCAREIVERFASRAFRRPAEEAEVDRLMELYELARSDEASFEEALQIVVQAVLVSPHFLFRVELGDPAHDDGASRSLTSYELATRLSYFLWSSMPDEELFDLAAQDRLRDIDVLRSQVARLLGHEKSRALVENFAGQWLQIRNLERVTPDASLFPEFDEALREAMREETLCGFEHVMRENRSVLELLDSDYTFVNERLARHYGIEGISGDEFRRVVLADERRGGLLTQASVLTITSNPTRTSPVKRGKWVLEQLLGTSPPPPPPGVPELEEGGEKLTGTLRQRMEQHRENAGCASCHAPMDPLGFGLENFDAVGAWRDRDGEYEIDASGELPSGQRFAGPAELRKVLVSKQDEFRRCLAEKMLVYALGRGLEYYDRCTVDQLVETLVEHDDRFESLIVAIVESVPFQRVRSTPEQQETAE